MYQVIRPLRQPGIVLLFIIAAVFLTGCGAEVAAENWPGLSVSDSVVYVAYGQGVTAVDVGERRQLWTFPEEPNPALNFFAPPSITDTQIVVGDYGQAGGFFSPATTVTIYALENEPGASGTPSLVWSRDDLARDRIIAPPTQTPTQVFVGTADNRVLALDAATGDLQWEFSTQHSIWAKPLYDEGVLYIASLDNFVYAVEADTGEELWRAELGGSIASQPSLGDGILYVPSFDRGVHALDATTGEELWTAPATDWVWGSPVVANGTVFYADVAGNIVAVSAESGETQWTVTVESAIQSTPLYHDGVLYVATGQVNGDEDERTGELLALDAGDGSELWRRQTPQPVFTSPAAVDEGIVVAIRTNGAPRLLLFEAETGNLAWEFTPPAE